MQVLAFASLMYVKKTFLRLRPGRDTNTDLSTCEISDLLPEILHLAGAAPSKRSGEHGEIICYQYVNTSRDATVANAKLPISTGPSSNVGNWYWFQF